MDDNEAGDHHRRVRPVNLSSLNGQFATHVQLRVRSGELESGARRWHPQRRCACGRTTNIPGPSILSTLASPPTTSGDSWAPSAGSHGPASSCQGPAPNPWQPPPLAHPFSSHGGRLRFRGQIRVIDLCTCHGRPPRGCRPGKSHRPPIDANACRWWRVRGRQARHEAVVAVPCASGTGEQCVAHRLQEGLPGGASSARRLPWIPLRLAQPSGAKYIVFESLWYVHILG